LSHLHILMEGGLDAGCKIKVVTFGSPMIFSVSDGDPDSVIPAELREEHYAYVNADDLVPRLLGTKPEASWDGYLHAAENELGGRFKSTVGLAAGTAIFAGVAATVATGGIATAAALVGSGLLASQVGSNVEEYSKLAGEEHSTADVAGRAAGAFALREVLSRLRSLRLLDSPEARSYTPVGQFRFVGGPAAGSACEHRRGGAALERLQIPKPGGMGDSVRDHNSSSYVEALARLLQP
jgi:hypothetical protein